MLEIKNLVVQIEDKRILNGLNLTVNKGEVAAIMMEPARSELPSPGYLEQVKDLAQAHDVILIFDEVSCGWRLAIGGVAVRRSRRRR